MTMKLNGGGQDVKMVKKKVIYHEIISAFIQKFDPAQWRRLVVSAFQLFVCFLTFPWNITIFNVQYHQSHHADLICLVFDSQTERWNAKRTLTSISTNEWMAKRDFTRNTPRKHKSRQEGQKSKGKTKERGEEGTYKFFWCQQTITIQHIWMKWKLSKHQHNRNKTISRDRPRTRPSTVTNDFHHWSDRKKRKAQKRKIDV